MEEYGVKHLKTRSYLLNHFYKIKVILAIWV